MGWVQVLTTTTANEQLTAKAIASIARNAQAQTRVIEDLVDVSRIVTGKMHLRFQVIDLRTPVQAAGDAVESVAEAKGVTFRMELPDAPCLVNGDADRIQQVVGNLLSNALKFTRPGGAVRVELCESGGIYEIQVRDTGIGINPEFLPYVFDRFRQADGSITREHGGLGLGLAIVKELTELHGGSVQARSAGQGQGATFVIRLPQLVSAATTVARGSSDELPPLALQGLRVLAVDDHADARDVLSIALSTAGAEVTAAKSGRDALAAWDGGRYDVIICDVAMPGIDGFELLRRIRNTPAGRTIPAIAVTAHASAEHRARSRAAGFDEHIAKPYRNAELLQNIRQLLASHDVRPADTGSGTSARGRGK